MEFTQFLQGGQGGAKKDDGPKKDEKNAEFKMTPITFLMWIWALSIPVAAANIMVAMTVGKYIMTMFR